MNVFQFIKMFIEFEMSYLTVVATILSSSLSTDLSFFFQHSLGLSTSDAPVTHLDVTLVFHNINLNAPDRYIRPD